MEKLSRTAFDNTEHLVPPSLEDDPGMYQTVVTGNSAETMGYLKRGSRLSISVNMENFNIYIGGNHMSMQENANISAANLCAAYVRFDKNQGKVVVEDFTDWRKGVAVSGAANAIAEAMQRDLIDGK